MDETVTVPLPEEIASIYAAVARLEERYPGRKFTPDGHLVGSIGEVIAAEQFGLELLPNSTPAHDARDQAGRLVQVKLTAGRSVSLYADCEMLLVLRIASLTTAELVYYGEGGVVWDACGPMQKNGQRTVPLSRLRRIAASRHG
jgi:hypothetical protein